MMKIAHGIITKFMIRPRAGHHALAHLTIEYHEHQIAPSMRNTDLHGDFHPIDWDDYYEVYQPPYELKLIGWNEDDSYQHTFDVFIAVLPRKAIVPLTVVDTLKNFLGVLIPKKVSLE